MIKIARLLKSQLEWEDLILPGETMEQVEELHLRIRQNVPIPGYRVLFYGPPGTGKTLTASLLGKHTGRAVYRIDLSMVVSRFIGETEKNLAILFDRAENKDWILFFDEADALFGKRTSVKDAHDKYANQEVSYLLQRIENFDGLLIMASNIESIIDDYFLRRFRSRIYFPVPKYDERLKLWKKAFPDKVKLDDEIDLSVIARQFELTGSNIVNIAHYVCLKNIHRCSNKISASMLLTGIEKELRTSARG
jgi:SpoVK/Ycf46/Vps4 family AAA+-type ATPase